MGQLAFHLGIDLPSEASYRSQANGSLDESVPRIKWIERLSGARTFFAALAAFVSVRNIVVDGDPRGLWTLVVGCGWLVGVTMQIIAGANCAPGPEFVRRLVRFSKQRSHVRIVSGAPEKQVPGVPGLWLVNWSKPAFCRCSLLLHTRPGEVVTSSVLKVAGSGNNFEDRGRPWSQGAGGRVRIFAPMFARSAHSRENTQVPGH